MMKEYIKSMKNKISKFDIFIFSMIIVGIIINEIFLIIGLLLLISTAFYDVYEVYTVAWNNPHDVHKPIQDNRGFGFPVIMIFIGYGIWAIYFYDNLAPSSELYTLFISGFFVIFLIPTMISSVVTVMSIALIQKYKIKKHDLKQI